MVLCVYIECYSFSVQFISIVIYICHELVKSIWNKLILLSCGLRRETTCDSIKISWSNMGVRVEHWRGEEILTSFAFINFLLSVVYLSYVNGGWYLLIWFDTIKVKLMTKLSDLLRTIWRHHIDERNYVNVVVQSCEARSCSDRTVLRYLVIVRSEKLLQFKSSFNQTKLLVIQYSWYLYWIKMKINLQILYRCRIRSWWCWIGTGEMWSWNEWLIFHRWAEELFNNFVLIDTLWCTEMSLLLNQ